MVIPSHILLVAQYIWYLFYPCCAWALLYRRIHRVLHIFADLLVLSRLGERTVAWQPRPVAHEDMVSAFLFLWKQLQVQGSSAERIWMANNAAVLEQKEWVIGCFILALLKTLILYKAGMIDHMSNTCTHTNIALTKVCQPCTYKGICSKID